MGLLVSTSVLSFLREGQHKPILIGNLLYPSRAAGVAKNATRKCEFCVTWVSHLTSLDLSSIMCTMRRLNHIILRVPSLSEGVGFYLTLPQCDSKLG